MRKLASIQRIVKIESIPTADNIEVATVLGWSVIIKRNDFKVGELCVYCEIDSILPDRPEFEFLRERKFRIKTIKLKNQVSQGICFPLSVLPSPYTKYKEGDDVTAILGVTKYDPEAEFERKESLRLATIDKNRMDKFLKRYAWYRNLIFKPSKKPFPSFIRKTDEDRIQLFPDYFNKWGHLKFTITEKIDGQSATYFCVPNPKRGLFRKRWLFGVCSRNFQLLEPDKSSYWTIAKKLSLEAQMKAWCKARGKGLIIQGEAVGVGIQGNKYNLKDIQFYVFNVAEYYRGKTIYYDQIGQKLLCLNFGNLVTVPVLYPATYLLPTVPEMVEFSVGISKLHDVPREGIVVRNYEAGVSFKIINPQFLLKYNE